MLKEKNRQKTVTGTTAITLIADANESYRVKNIEVYGPTTNYATITVDRLVVGYYRVGGNLGNHLPFRDEVGVKRSLLGILIERGIFRPIPIPSGMTLTITGVAVAGAITTITYDVYDKDDVKPNEPNGIESRDYDLIQYGRYSTTLADGDNLYATQQTDNSFPPFPFGDVVPAKHTFTMRGILATPVHDGGTAPARVQDTQRMRLVQDRTVLFDEDRLGFPLFASAVSVVTLSVGGVASFTGNQSDVDAAEPYFFDPPKSFPAGEELNVYVTTSLSAGTALIAAADAEVGFIFNVRKDG